MKEPRVGPAAAGFGMTWFVVVKPEASAVDPAPAIRDPIGYLRTYDHAFRRLCNDDEHVSGGSETT